MGLIVGVPVQQCVSGLFEKLVTHRRPPVPVCHCDLIDPNRVYISLTAAHLVVFS